MLTHQDLDELALRRFEAEVARLEADKAALQARERELMLEVSRLTHALNRREELREISKLIDAPDSWPGQQMRVKRDNNSDGWVGEREEPPHNWLNRGVERVGRIMP